MTATVEHGFVRDAYGNYTTFDVAGGNAVTSALLSQNGEVAGTYTDASFLSHGFVRDTLGNITTFDAVVPGGITDGYGINASGEIAGEYLQSGSYQGFVRDTLGNITTFKISGLPYAGVAGIADNGNVYGVSKTGSDRGWKYTGAGVVSYFNDPSAGPKGSSPSSASGNNKAAGVYWDSQGVLHDFYMSQ